MNIVCPNCKHVLFATDAGGAPTVAPQAPTGNAAPRCASHGPMIYKSGTNKSGKPYSGFFCTVQGCETTPVWDPK